MRRRVRHAVVASVVAVASCLVVALPASADRPRVTLIGDSTLLGMRADGVALVAAHHDVNLQAASCRRLVEVSCDIPFRPTNTIEVMHAQDGRLGQALVIMAGYDDFDIADAIDTVVAEARRQGVDHVVWLTYMEDVAYTGLGGRTYADIFRQHNAVLRAKASAEPMLVLADWNEHARSHPEWFARDGIHLSSGGSAALGAFIGEALDAIPVSRCVPLAAGGTAEPGGSPAVPDGSASGFHAIAPIRVLDTRDGPKAVGARQRITVDVGAAVPAEAITVAATVTAIDTCAPGFVTAHPCGALPLASNLDPATDSIVAGHVIAPLAPGTATFCLSTSVQTDLAVDVSGWYGGSGDGLVPVEPRRLLDTRTNGARALAGTAVAVSTPALAGHAAVLNLTTTGSSAPGFLTAYPAGSNGACDPGVRPLASNVNAPGGATVADLAQVLAGGGGVVCVYTSADTDVVVDLAGTYAASGGGPVHGVAPTRLIDTREGAGTPVGAGTSLAVSIPEAGATAVALNITSVDALNAGFVTAQPAAGDGSCAGPVPLASMLNYVGAAAVANLTISSVGGQHTVCLYTKSTTHLVVDETAWFG